MPSTSQSSDAAEATATSSLADFVASLGGERQLRVEENLGSGFVRLRVAEAERRQAKHDIRCVEDVVIELLRNARDAGASQIFVATGRDGALRTTTMLDDGSGIPDELQERVFDARVTSKLESMRLDRWGVHGRGMALYSVRENALEAAVVSSGVGKGASIRVVTDTEELGERADQSTWPSLGIDDDGNASVVRGPHNIVRACCEFALEERGRCEVYVGTQAEIVSTARRRVRPTVDSTRLLFIDDLTELPVLERLRVAADAGELTRIAASLGLSISERTAHRILGGHIRPLRDVYARLAHRPAPDRAAEVDLMRDRRGLRLSEEDGEAFSRIMERDFAFIAERYYLNLASEPRVRCGRGRITVTFLLEDGD